jgi:hypothetical protein
MDLTPTVSFRLSDESIVEAAKSIRDANPDVPPETIAKQMIENAKNSPPTFNVSSPQAVFLGTGVIVENFFGSLNFDFQSDGDRYFVLSSGDVVNITEDARSNAERIFKVLSE